MANREGDVDLRGAQVSASSSNFCWLVGTECLSTTLQLARLVERVSNNFDERRLTGAVFLDVAKAFDTVWVDGLLYKLINLNFLSDFVTPLSSYLNGRTYETSFRTATSTSRRMRADIAQGGIISPVLFKL